MPTIGRATAITAVAMLLLVGSSLELASPAAAEDASYSIFDVSGDPGDYLAAGASYTLSPPAAELKLSGQPSWIQVNATTADHLHDWMAALTSPDTTVLSGVHLPTPGGDAYQLHVTGNSHGCNSYLNAFRIHQVEQDPATGNVIRLAVSFEQHCEGVAPAIQGFFAVNATGTPPEATTVSINAPALLTPGVSTHLTGSVHDTAGPRADAEVSIRRVSAGVVTVLGTVRTDPSGSYAFDDTADADAMYTAVYLVACRN